MSNLPRWTVDELAHEVKRLPIADQRELTRRFAWIHEQPGQPLTLIGWITATIAGALGYALFLLAFAYITR